MYNFIIVDDWCPTLPTLDLYWQQAQGCQAEVFVVHCGGGEDPLRAAADFELCVQRNVHDIPRSVLEAMRDAWEPLDARYCAVHGVEALLEGSDAEGRRLDAMAEQPPPASPSPERSPDLPVRDHPRQHSEKPEQTPLDEDTALATSEKLDLAEDLPEPPRGQRWTAPAATAAAAAEAAVGPPRKRPRGGAAAGAGGAPSALQGLLSAYCKKRVRWADLEGLAEEDCVRRQEEEDARHVADSEFMRRVRSEEQRFAHSQREALLTRVKKTT